MSSFHKQSMEQRSGAPRNTFGSDYKPACMRASAPRGRTALHDTISPSERCLCNHRQAQRSRLAWLLCFGLPSFPWRKFSAERTILVARILVNTCVLKPGCGAWIWCHESVLCVCVNCTNTLFCPRFSDEGHVSSKGPRLMSQSTIPGQSNLRCLQQEKRAHNFRGTVLAAHPE